MSSISDGISIGVPMFPVSQGVDLFINAYRLQELGAGKVFVLANKTLKVDLNKVQEYFTTVGSPSLAVKIVEKLLAKKMKLIKLILNQSHRGIAT